MKKILKVGFDLDGVILYNPIRILRLPAKMFLKPLKAKMLHQKKEGFYLPKSKLERFLWRLVHLSSFMPNRGYADLKALSRQEGMKFYLITGRYGFLRKDYESWLRLLDAGNVFDKCYINEENMQPNEFKEKKIKELGLDVYVEDNWDIIEKLNHHTSAKILWLSNLVDRNRNYRFKFFSLGEICRYLKTLA